MMEFVRKVTTPNVRYENNFVASIQFGYWMGHVNEVGDDWYVIQCLYCTNNPHFSNHYNYIRLPSNGDELDQLAVFIFKQDWNILLRLY